MHCTVYAVLRSTRPRRPGQEQTPCRAPIVASSFVLMEKQFALLLSASCGLVRRTYRPAWCASPRPIFCRYGANGDRGRASRALPGKRLPTTTSLARPPHTFLSHSATPPRVMHTHSLFLQDRLKTQAHALFLIPAFPPQQLALQSLFFETNESTLALFTPSNHYI